MRLACTALVFSLLVLQKDPNGEPPLRYSPWSGRLCQEQSGLWRLRGTFCWQPDVCWVTESSWGSCLVGVAMVLLWALLESWAASCLASLQTKAPRSPVCSGSPPLPHEFGPCSCFPGHAHTATVLPVTGYLLGSPTSRKLDFLCASGDSSSAKRSLESIIPRICGPSPQSSGPESKSSASSSTPPDPSVTEEEEEKDVLCLEAKEKPPPPRGSLLLLEKCSQTESVSLPLQPREIQTQTPFSRLTIIQSSAYKDRVLLVQKSLQVQMGAVPVPKAQPLLKLTLTDDLRKRGRPAILSLMELTSLQHADKTRKGKLLASLCGLLGPFERAVPKASPQSRECSGLSAIFASASSLDEFTRAPSLMEKVDKDTRDLLEFHVKKKMVQWKCGMPSVVAKSIAEFQSLCGDKPVSDSRMPTGTITLTSRRRLSLALRLSPLAIVGTYSSERTLELKETSALSSWKPEDIRQLAFHLAVKMLEIKTGAFPERVGDSFRLFLGLSRKPLPKTIRSGNKILKAKHPLLPFLTQENVCILDLNIRRKCLAYAGNFSAMYTRVTATVVTSISPRRRESEEVPRQRMAQLLVSIWRQILGMQILRMQIHRTQISPLGLSQRLPLPQLLDSSASSPSPSSSVEESPEAPFQGGPLIQLVASQVPLETPEPPEEPPLAKGLEKSHQEQPPEQEPSQRTLLLSFGQPDPKSSASSKALKFRAEASIVRTSIYLELELKKEKLNLHLKKRIRAHLQMRQGVGLELKVEPRRKARASPSPRPAPSSARPLGRPRRSFCYVCMPSDESGTELKTVCWSLPKWILEMNGYRTPEVARFDRRSRTPQPVQK
ncbi:UNVERIFIED_CONTAM: hypothetical protein K2H54_017455 [Gekko kuhli]